jgi:hypothetical protein
VNDLGFCVQEVDGVRNLNKNAPAFRLFHVCAKLNVIEQIHAREAVWSHLNVVVHIVLEEAFHFYNVGVSELGFA